MSFESIFLCDSTAATHSFEFGYEHHLLFIEIMFYLKFSFITLGNGTMQCNIISSSLFLTITLVLIKNCTTEILFSSSFQKELILWLFATWTKKHDKVCVLFNIKYILGSNDAPWSCALKCLCCFLRGSVKWLSSQTGS